MFARMIPCIIFSCSLNNEYLIFYILYCFFAVSISKSQTEINRKKRIKVSVALPGPYQPPPKEPPVPPPFPSAPHQVDEEQQVPLCFLTPCATSHNHYWLGERQPESRGSYCKFIINSVGWNDNRYLLKKVAAGGQVNDKRELIRVVSAEGIVPRFLRHALYGLYVEI